MTDPIEREVPALLHQLAVENGRLTEEVARLRDMLQSREKGAAAVHRDIYDLRGRVAELEIANEQLHCALRAILAEGRPPFSYGSAFDNCQRIATQALAKAGDEE